MATFGDFSSLLQLGVGTGIGLSFFRAPVDLRVVRLVRTIEIELAALDGVDSAFAKRKWRDISDVRMRLADIKEKLDAKMLPFMIAALCGSVIDVIALIDGTLNSDLELVLVAQVWFTFISVGWFIFIIGALEFVARRGLGKLQLDLLDIRRRRAN